MQHITCNLIYIMSFYYFLASIIIVSLAGDNEEKNLSKYYLILGMLYIIYSIFNIDIIWKFGVEDGGFEIFLYRALEFITILLLIISIGKSSNKIKLDKKKDNFKSEKVQLVAMMILPIALFGILYILL